MARLAVPHAGNDFATVFVSEEKKVISKGAKIIQAWINMGQPWSEAVVDILRDRGYFTGGVLPRWFDTDGLLMMKILHRPHWDDMQIYFDRAGTIAALIKQDWERSLG